MEVERHVLRQRSRTIQPGTFSNEKLAELEPLIRILFIGLWTIADREGRLEDRPTRIKVFTLPYDDIDIDDALQQLHDSKFLLRYEVDGQRYIEIPNFKKYQSVHPHESQSVIPAPQPDVPPCNDMSRDANTDDTCDSSRSKEVEVEVEVGEKEGGPRGEKERFDPIVQDLSEFLKQGILENKPDRKLSASWKTATRAAIEKMIRIDRRKPERIRAVIEWCQADNEPRGRDNFCWAPNILSGEKLRKQFDRLETDMRRLGTTRVSGVTQHNIEVTKKWLEET